jgi:hypothetical protein
MSVLGSLVRKLFPGRDAPPAEAVIALPEGERVVSWADVRVGGVLLATPAGLWWPEADGPRLIDWYRISKAVWQTPTLTVTEADIVDDLLVVDRAPVAVELSVPRDLPAVVRKRVEGGLVRSELLTIPGGSARFVARRVPGRDGVRWWARLEHGTPDTAEVRSAVQARLARLRVEMDAERADL